MTGSAPIGFIGLGAMGEPMALNLARAGSRVVVWNRSPGKTGPLAEAGAVVAPDPRDVFRACPVVFLMLADEAAIDGVLGRTGSGLAVLVRDRTVVNMATVSPAYSQALESEVRAAGGAFVEAPVSGSRKPAEAGQLVAMLAGDAEACDRVRPLLGPMCRSVVACGAIPGALSMKLAVNVFLIASVTGLAEAVNFARAQGLDLATFYAVVNASQMASDISRAKVAKLEAGDLGAQAAISNVLATNRLIAEAARAAGIAAPLTEACEALYREAADSGLAAEDMIAVVKVLAARATRRT